MKKNLKKFAAVCLSGSLLAAGMAATGAYQSSFAMAEEADDGVSLSIADRDEEPETEGAEKETEAAQESTAVEYETLETTKTGEGAVNAIDVTEIVENVMPSIVSITETSVQEVEDFFYGRRKIELQGAGSGIIIAQNDSELLIATNNHIVEDSTEITVCFSVDADDPDDLLVSGLVKGKNSKHDLAVVAVNIADIKEDVYRQLKVATLGSSDDLKVGEASLVIGNALGVGQTVTTGIISALEREIKTESGTFTELQTDAAINLGCSGGAILNSRGEVVGIVDAKSVADYAESMGYGIPIDTAIPVLQDLINRKTREAVDEHGYLGITVVPVSDEAIQMYDMPAGAYVYEVNSGSAAEKAGISKGDIITGFDGISIDTSTTLVDTLGYYAAGETVKVEIQSPSGSSYETKEVEVTLQEATKEQKEAMEKEKEEEKKRGDDNSSDGDKADKDNEDDENTDDYGYYDYYQPDDYSGSVPGFEDFFFGGNGNGFFGF